MVEHRSQTQLIDPLSVGLVRGGLLGIVFALIRGNEVGWKSWVILAPLTAGMILIGCFLARQRSHQSPMLDLKLFSSRPFAMANVIGFVSSLGMFGSIFFITLFVQGVWGWSPLAAGLGTMPWTGTIMLIAPFAGVAMSRFGARTVVVGGMSAQAAALLWIGLSATASSSYLSLLPAFILGGLGMGLAFAPLSATAMSGLCEERHGGASGAYNALREVGGVFGIAALGAVFQAVVGRPGDFVSGFHAALKVASIIIAVGAAASLLLPGRTPMAGPQRAQPDSGLLDTEPVS